MVERMIAATFELLGSDDFVAKTNPPPLHLLAPADSDWSGFAPWLLQRVNDINAVGGPRMRVEERSFVAPWCVPAACTCHRRTPPATSPNPPPSPLSNLRSNPRRVLPLWDRRYVLRPYGRRRAVVGPDGRAADASPPPAASVGWSCEENAQILHHAQCAPRGGLPHRRRARGGARHACCRARCCRRPPSAAIVAQPTNDLFLCGLVPLLCADDERPPALDNHTSVWAGTAVGLQRRLPCLRPRPHWPRRTI